MTCTICGSETYRRFAVHGLWIRKCPACGFELAEIECGREHVYATYSDSYFNSGGAGYPDYLAEGELLMAHGRRYGVLLSRRGLVGSVLDVGCAAGFLTKGFQQAGWTVKGLEPNERMAGYARAALGVPVKVGDLEEGTGEQFDVVSMIQVIAHFFDLRKALGAAAAATRSGGHWLIETWDRSSWTARLFGSGWHEYSPPSVLRWFSPGDLDRIAASFGFERVAQGRPSKWIKGAHIRSLVRHKVEASWMEGAANLLTRAIPAEWKIPYPAEDLFWVLYRKRVDAT